MANNLELALRIRALVDGLKNVAALTSEVEQLGHAAGIPLDDPTQPLDDGAKRTAGNLENVRQKVLAIAAAIGAGALAKSFLDTANTFERFSIQLETIEGSSEGAQRALDWISEFTAKTPYALDETTDAFTRLKAYGIDPTTGTLKTLGDTAAAMGKPLNQAVEALADAVTGEYERLKEFGIKAETIGDTVKFRYIHNGQEMVKEADRTSGDMIRATLEAIWNERYAGGMEKFSKSWEGMASNLDDLWTQFQRDVMDAGVFDALKAELADVLRAINEMSDDGSLKEWAQAVGASIASLISSIADVTKWLAENRAVIIELIKWYGAYKVATSNVLGTLTQLGATVKNVSAAMRAMTFAEMGSGAVGAAGQVKKLETALLGLKAVGVVIAAELGYAIGSKLRDELKDTFTWLRTETERIEAETRDFADRTGNHLIRIARESAEQLSQYHDQAIAASTDFQKMTAQELSSYQDRIDAARRYWGYQVEIAKLTGDTTALEEARRKYAEYEDALHNAAGAAAELEKRISQAARAGEPFREQADHIAQNAAAARQLANELSAAAAMTEDATKQIDKLIGGLNLANPQVIEQLAQAMGMLRSESADAAAMVEQQLVGAIAKLDGRQLQAFSTALKGAFAAGSMAAEELAEIADVVLAESFKRLGLVAETQLGRISPAAQGAIASLDAIRASLVGAADEGAAKMAALGNAITATLARADTPAAVEQIRLRIEEMGKSGELAGQQLEEAMRRARERMDELKPGINSVEEAFRKLGITSQAALRQAADEAREAYQVIRGGDTTIADQQQAWRAWASAAVKSGDEATLALVRAEGQALGLTDELTKMGLAGAEAGKKIAGGANEAADATRRMADELANIRQLQEQQTQQIGTLVEEQRQAVNAWNAYWTNIRDGYYAMSEAIGEYYDRTLEMVTTNAAVKTSISQMRELGREMGYATERFREQAAAAESLTQRLSDSGRVTAGLVREAERAAASFEYLGEQQLEPLRNAIAAARAEMEALAESASRTLESLQDELDRMDGREEAIAQRRAERRRAELEAQLEIAKAYRDTDTITQLQEAIRLSDELAKREREKARATEQERKAREADRQDADRQQRETRTTTTTTTPREPVQPVRTVRVELAMGTRVTPIDVQPGQEAALEAFFRQLEHARGTAQ